MKVFKHLHNLTPVCRTELRLVNGAHPIPDEMMWASSFYSDQDRPYFARIDAASNWCASNAELDAHVPNFFIEVSRYVMNYCSKLFIIRVHFFLLKCVQTTQCTVPQNFKF